MNASGFDSAHNQRRGHRDEHTTKVTPNQAAAVQGTARDTTLARRRSGPGNREER